MKTTTIKRLKLALRSIKEEASGNLEGNRSEGLHCIASELQIAIREVQKITDAATKVVQLADPTGCTGDLTVTSKKAIKALSREIEFNY